MSQTFNEFGLSDEVIKAISAMGFTEPTPVQKAAIPPALEGRDVIGLAQTGTGKTAAFGIPLVEASERPSARAARKNPRAIVLVPTRELAVQAAKELNRIGTGSRLKTLAVYGGQSIVLQIKALRKGVDVIVGTPGRVIDHIRRKTLLLSDIRTVVLDEADEMLNMGFVEDMETILREVPDGRQTLLFSATMPAPIMRIARTYMVDPATMRASTNEVVVAKIHQKYYAVRSRDKVNALMRLLDVEDTARTLVFCPTKKEVDELARALREGGYAAGGIHGDHTQELRDETMRRFRTGGTDILVATDVAARGLDIPDVTHVVNFSLPQNPESYVHRIGRTGRAGKTGTAITFVTSREFRALKGIERTARTTIEKGTLPTTADVKRARGRRLICTVDQAIGDGRHLPHRDLVQELCSRYAPEEIAAAAIGLVAGEAHVPDIAEETLRTQGSATRGRFVKLKVTLGRKDGIGVADLVKSIAMGSRISGRDIGKIALHNNHSLVEIPPHLADRVMAAMQNQKLRGRLIQVRPAPGQAA